MDGRRGRDGYVGMISSSVFILSSHSPPGVHPPHVPVDTRITHDGASSLSTMSRGFLRELRSSTPARPSRGGDRGFFPRIERRSQTCWDTFGMDVRSIKEIAGSAREIGYHVPELCE